MFEEITGMLAGAVGFIFSPLLVFNPMVSLFIVSAVITVLITVLSRLLTNTKVMKELKDKMQEVREQLTNAQKAGDKEGANKFLEEMMSMNSEFMKHSYKSMFISLIVIMIFLPFLKVQYEGAAVAALPFEVPFIGSSLSWLLWYVLVSFTIGWVVRKLFGFE